MPAHPETTIVQLNHPRRGSEAHTIDYGIDDYDGNFAALLAASDHHVRLIEVIKGSAQSDSVDSEHRQGTYAGDDRKKTWGRSMHARMGGWAGSLARDGIEEATFDRHCFASEDDSIRVAVHGEREDHGLVPAADRQRPCDPEGHLQRLAWGWLLLLTGRLLTAASVTPCAEMVSAGGLAFLVFDFV